MDLTPYLDSLRRDLTATAAPAGEAASQTADLLARALESAARLSLLEALSDAAAEITTKLGTATVEVRLRGRDVDLVVTEVVTPEPPAPPPAGDGADLARITLRLPESLKEQVERAAASEGISVNGWLVRAAAAGLHAEAGRSGGSRGEAAFPPGGRGRGRRITGFAQA
jgi:hypothetical protein